MSVITSRPSLAALRLLSRNEALKFYHILASKSSRNDSYMTRRRGNKHDALNVVMQTHQNSAEFFKYEVMVFGIAGKNEAAR